MSLVRCNEKNNKIFFVPLCSVVFVIGLKKKMQVVAHTTQRFTSSTTASAIKMVLQSKYKFIDIAVNLTDPMFRGVYRGKQVHDDDLDLVIQRAKDCGMQKMIVTGTTLPECQQAIDLCQKHSGFLYCTVGVHPTHCTEFLVDGKREDEDHARRYMDQLIDIGQRGKEQGIVVAVGEFGLDYDRLHFCEKDVQLKYFEQQFELCEKLKLPLFLHDRNTGSDLFEILQRNRDKWTTGVVHSFTGSLDDAERLLSMDGIFIGINGCSLKTQENLDVVKQLPLERLMLETDAPWCQIRGTHASNTFVQTRITAKKRFEMGHAYKSRNEPCYIVQVLETLAGIKGLDPSEVADICLENTMKVFFPDQPILHQE